MMRAPTGSPHRDLSISKAISGIQPNPQGKSHALSQPPSKQLKAKPSRKGKSPHPGRL